MNYEYVIKILQRAEAVEPMQPVYKDDADYNRVEKIIIAARAEALEEVKQFIVTQWVQVEGIDDIAKSIEVLK